jgi:S1-C subfamily serine protease
MSGMRLCRGVAALAVAAATANPAWALTAEQVYAKVSGSVWRVRTYDGDNLPLGQGSAVVVAAGAAVTNCHVLAKAKRVSVQREKEAFDASLELWDVQRDVCQLKVPDLRAAPVALGDSNRVAVGQNAYAIGNPKGLELTMSAGLVSSLRRNAAGQLVLIQTSAAISGGSSGGGLFDDQGRLIGLTTLGSVTGDAQNLNFAIPAQWVGELAQRHAQAKAARAVTEGATSSAAAAPTPAPAPAPAPATAPAPAPAQDFARLDDIDKLPFATERMRERYRNFLTRPLPRAFVISEGGDARLSSGADSSPAVPADRAMRECEKARTGRCIVYAVDDRVVWRPEPTSR